MFQKKEKEIRQLRTNGFILFSIFLISGLFLIFYHLLYPDKGFILCQTGFICLLYASHFFLCHFKADILSPSFLMTFYFFCAYTIAPLYLVFFKDLSLTDPNQELTMWYVVIFIFLFFIGYHSRFGAIVARKLPTPPTNWLKRNIFIVLALCFISGMFGWFIILFILDYTPVTQFQNVFQFRYTIFETPFLYNFRNLVIWSLWLLFWAPFLHFFLRDESIKNGKVMFFLVSFFLLLTFFSFGFGQRFLVVSQIVSLLFIINMTKKKLGLSHIMLALFLIILFARFYENFRGLSWRSLDFSMMVTESLKFDKKSYSFLGKSVIQDGGVPDMLLFSIARQVNLFDCLYEIICSYPPPGYDFLYGQSYIYLLFSFFPRSIFGSLREIFTDTYLTRISTFRPYTGMGGITDYGVGYGQIAELYINFQELALMGGLIWGIVLKIVDHYAELHKRNAAVMLYFTSGYVNLLTYSFLLSHTTLYSVTTVDLAVFMVLNTFVSFILSNRLT